MSELQLIIQPDEEDSEAAEVLVEGTIGDRAYRFLLDTGAARTSVDFDAYTARFPSSETNSSSGVFANGSYDIITVPAITTGGLAFQLAEHEYLQWAGLPDIVGSFFTERVHGALSAEAEVFVAIPDSDGDDSAIFWVVEVRQF